MAFIFKNLDEETRKLMVSEINSDHTANKLYISSRLNYQGRERWKDLLEAAAFSRNEEWLADQIATKSLLNATVLRQNKPVKMPVTASVTLAEGEFNRFYIRALCLRAIKEGRQLEIYRAKAVHNPRGESEQHIGTTINPKKLLDDLRGSTGFNTEEGIPGGPNSGLSVCLR